MINETRDSFDTWVIETYESLHESLYTGRKFNLRYLLSGEMFSYLILKLWYCRVMNLEDIRDDIPADCVQEIREYLDNPSLDNQVVLLRWFLPREEKELDDIQAAVLMPIVAYGIAERIRFLREKGFDYSLEDAFSWLLDNEDALEDSYYHVMDMIDRFNEEEKEIPESLRDVVRFLEPEF